MSERALTTAPKQNTVSPVQVSGHVLQRKCSCGNHTVTGVCDECSKKRVQLQRKLTIGSSSDPLEREADRAADYVIGSQDRGVTAQQSLQRFASTSLQDGEVVPPTVASVLAHSGAPLDAKLQSEMAQKFGHDFSMVRVHTDELSAQSAREVGANAYAVGNHIVFGAGQFAPASASGRWLLAHELAHVVQQGAAKASEGGFGGRAEAAPKSAPASSAPRLSTSSRSILRRDVTGCQELLDNPGPPVPAAAGTFIHRAVLAFFMATVPGAIRINIPGAAAKPQRTGGGRTVKPELGGAAGPRADKGTPDLAALNAGGVLQVAEIKPANWNQLLEGETQVATRYIDQGNASDEPQVAWRARTGVKVVTPMFPQTFPVPSLFFPTPTNIIEVVLRWCQSGVLAYALRAHRRPEEGRARSRRRVPSTESEKQREQSPQTAPRPESLGHPGPSTTPAPGPSTSPAPSPGQTPAPAPGGGGSVVPFPGGKTPDRKPEDLPIAAKSAGEQILDFIADVIANGQDIEQAVTKFLKENPNIVRNVEIAVAAIAAGAILSDIFSAGTAIAKDPLVAAILAAMLRIAQAMRAAAPLLVP